MKVIFFKAAIDWTKALISILILWTIAFPCAKPIHSSTSGYKSAVEFRVIAFSLEATFKAEIFL
jgi:hypothetical protein